MIVWYEPILIPKENGWNDRHYLRIIRRHVRLGRIYYTDSYYQHYPDKTFNQGGRDVCEPLFCTIRDMTYKEDHGANSNPINVHFHGTRILLGRPCRNVALFRKENEGNITPLITHFPLESRHFSSHDVLTASFDMESRHILPDAPSRLSTDANHLLGYIPRSTFTEPVDDEVNFIGRLFLSDAENNTMFDIWRIAGGVKDHGLDFIYEDVHGCLDMYCDVLACNFLLQTNLFSKENLNNIPDNPHSDDGLYAYNVDGRYVVVQYINLEHNEFRHFVIDLLKYFVKTQGDYSSKTNHYTSLFHELEDYDLGGDVLFT